ncbi:M16 family metallopeptidase [Kordiimonas aquimaris]|uniref:M16 family metallopeptidase n=1 Tax=Kordiimonas aquimaris TaxID=707591 RepID=UPI0021D17C5B|nr:pitrilysin family protein [Kordiimonas aquimaris]
MSVEVTKLSNGLRVVSESRKSVETVTVGVWVDVGARFETERQNGLTHCLEHMLFKGTKKRTARDIAFEIEAVGGHMNAYTSRDNTTYYARVLKDDMELAVDLLADLVVNSVCDSAELEREKDVILQEIGQTLDTPDDVVFDNLQAAAFAGQPIGRTILGEADNVRAFTRDDLTEFLATHYLASNIVISAVGNLSHEKLIELVTDKFARLPTGNRVPALPAKYIGGKHVEVRDLEQMHLTLGWQGVSYHDDDYYAHQLYSTILGGGMSSRLFQEVREHRGLAYSVYSFSSSHAETGLFGIYAGTGPQMANELLPVINGEMELLAAGPNEQEFNVARAQLKAGLMMALEATTSRMEQIGRQMLVFDKIIPISEMIANVDAVTMKDVATVGANILSDSSPSLAAVGNKTATEFLN